MSSTDRSTCSTPDWRRTWPGGPRCAASPTSWVAGPRTLLVAAPTAGGRETIVAGCRARGLAVDVVAHTYDDERDGLPVPGAPADALVDETARWLAARLASGAPANGTARPAGTEAGA